MKDATGIADRRGSEDVTGADWPSGNPPRPQRYLVVFLVVAGYWALGRGLHLSLAQYQLLGVAIVLPFQRWVHRKPLRTLWVRSGPPLRVDARFTVVWVLFAAAPGYEAVRLALHGRVSDALLAGAAVAGAAGLAYALTAAKARTWRQMLLCVATVATIGALPQLIAVLLARSLHLHLVAGHSAVAMANGGPPLGQALSAGLGTFLIGLPLGFVIEEVFFRGALDSYLHRGDSGASLPSAVFISALWGLWHLTVGPHLLSSVAGVLVAQIVIGVPLSLWWRASGNLVVNNTAHAVLDAFRNGITGSGIF